MHTGELKTRDLAPIILRIGLSMVFLWFGITQLSDPNVWTALIPNWAVGLTGLNAEILVLANGAFETVFGFALLLGLFTRVSAFLLSLHMLSITWAVGYSATGVRDFGLAMGMIAILLYGHDDISLDALFAEKNLKENNNAAA